MVLCVFRPGSWAVPIRAPLRPSRHGTNGRVGPGLRMGHEGRHGMTSRAVLGLARHDSNLALTPPMPLSHLPYARAAPNFAPLRCHLVHATPVMPWPPMPLHHRPAHVRLCFASSPLSHPSPPAMPWPGVAVGGRGPGVMGADEGGGGGGGERRGRGRWGEVEALWLGEKGENE